MLQKLSIQNFILIDHLEVDFASGFTSITGETGAGKSIFVGALSMLLGRRAEIALIKEGATRSVIEGTFAQLPQQAIECLKANDLWCSDGLCILRREWGTSGRGRCFINDTPVALTTLSELSAHLIDIHSQHQNLLLTSEHFQLAILDRHLPDSSLTQQYQEQFTRYQEAHKQLVTLQKEIEQSHEAYDYNLFRYNELSEAALTAGEEITLEEQFRLLQHADEIKAALYGAYQILDSEEKSLPSQINSAIRLLSDISGQMPALEEYTERLDSVAIELQDIAQELSNKAESIESDPLLLERTEQRIDLLNTLFQKYHVTNSEALLSLQQQLAEQLEHCDNQEELLQEAQKKLEIAREKLVQLGSQLTEARTQVAQEVAQQLTQDLHLLELTHAQLAFSITPAAQPTLSGFDMVQLLFSANGAQTLRPVGDVASGGEMARIMLAIKSRLASREELPTILFDEIDTGVSGRVADRMGLLLNSMGQHMQVLAITHLPQIAARSTSQFLIEKLFHEESQTATTHLLPLSPQERETEIARLISGNSITPATLAAARELLTSTR